MLLLLALCLLAGCSHRPTVVQIPIYGHQVMGNPVTQGDRMDILTMDQFSDVVSYYDGRFKGKPGWTRQQSATSVTWTHQDGGTVTLVDEQQRTQISLNAPAGRYELVPGRLQ
ncbi:MAG: hypothetical protein ACYCW6_03165 [Candidatus Xenobia bacterium]